MPTNILVCIFFLCSFILFILLGLDDSGLADYLIKKHKLMQ